MQSRSDVLNFIKKTLKVDALDSDAGMGRTRHWDSVAHVDVLVGLESELEFNMPSDLIAKLTTAESLINYLLDQKIISE